MKFVQELDELQRQDCQLAWRDLVGRPVNIRAVKWWYTSFVASSVLPQLHEEADSFAEAIIVVQLHVSVKDMPQSSMDVKLRRQLLVIAPNSFVKY